MTLPKPASIPVPANSEAKTIHRPRQLYSACFVLAVAISVGLFRDATLLFRSHEPVGFDGYYYVLQIDSLRRQSRLYFPTSTPLVLCALTGVSYLTGDPISSVKIGSLALHTLLCLAVFTLLITATRSPWAAALGGVMVLLSGARLYMMSEFINYLAATTLIVWGGCAAAARASGRRLRWTLTALALFAGAALSHRSALVFILLLGVLALSLKWLTLWKQKGVKRYAALFVICLILFSPVILSVQRLVDLPAGLGEDLSVRPRWPFDPRAFAEEVILVLAAPLALFLLTRARDHLHATAVYVFGATALMSLLVTLNPFFNPQRELDGVAGRIRILAYVSSALLIPFTTWLLFRLRQRVAFYVLAFVAPLMIISGASRLPSGLSPAYLSARAELVETLPSVRHLLGAVPLVVAGHGDEFTVSYVLGVPAQQSPPRGGAYSVYWLLHRADALVQTPSAIILSQDGPGAPLVLIEDADLRRQLEGLAESERQSLYISNRHLCESLDTAFCRKGITQ